MGLGKSTDFDNGFKAGVAKGRLDMYRMVYDMYMDLVEWSEDATYHDDNAKYCDVCTVLAKLQLELLNIAEPQRKNL